MKSFKIIFFSNLNRIPFFKNTYIYIFFILSSRPISLIKEGVPYAMRSYNILISFILYCRDDFYFLIFYFYKFKNVIKYRSIIILPKFSSKLFSDNKKYIEILENIFILFYNQKIYSFKLIR